MNTPQKKISAAFLFLLLVIGISTAATTSSVETEDQNLLKNQKVVVEKSKKILGGGSLEYKEGIPFLTLSGSYYEMGYQYGSLMNDEIHTAYTEMDKSMEAFFSLVPWIMRPVARMMYNCSASTKEKTIPQNYREELKGFADATDLDYENIIRIIFSSDIVGNLACTSVIVNSSGTIIHGRNLDFPPTALGRFPLITEYKPEGKKSYSLLGIVGYLPALSGMNDSGISVTLNISFLVDEHKKAGMPVGYKIRDILESASKINDIDSLMNGYASDGGWFFTIASSSEKTGAIYDIAGDQIRKSPMESKFIFAENKFLNDELNFKYTQIEEAESDYNINRIRKVAEIGKNIKNVNDMTEMLRNTEYYGYKNAFGKFTINNYETVQSMVLLPGSGDIYFSYAPMFASYAKMIAYNRNSGKVSVFRNADPRIESAEIKALLASADLFYVDPEKALREIKPDDANLLDITFAYQVWSFDEDSYNLTLLIPSIDRYLAKYPDDAFLLKMKGDALIADKRYVDSIPFLEEGLKSGIAAGGDKMKLHALLAKAYDKTDRTELASQHAKLALDMLSKYKLNDEQKELKNKLEGIVRN